MKIYQTETLSPEAFKAMGSDEANWVYNGLDCCVTFEVSEVLDEYLADRPRAQVLYDFERAMQAPAMDMMRRGILIDGPQRVDALLHLHDQISRLEQIIDRLASACWDRRFEDTKQKGRTVALNPRSPKQLCEFFYGLLKIPTITKKDLKTGEKKPTTDKDALDKLKGYSLARPFVLIIESLRNAEKLAGVLSYGIEPSGRFHASFSVAATKTTRWSSSGNAFGRGGNLQNITERLRRPFIPDKGKKFGYPDLASAESKCVAYVSGDEKYIEAHEGDTHTYVCRLVWPELPWNGDLKKDREIAEGIKWVRDLNMRDGAKRVQHGSNLGGTPFGISMVTGIPLRNLEDGQARYFHAFPGIRTWQIETAQEIQTTGKLVTPFGIERIFFDRLNSDETIKQALSTLPQSMIAAVTNLGMWRMWKHGRELLELLAQVHDAVLFQFLIQKEEEVWDFVGNCFKVPITVNYNERYVKRIGVASRTFTINSERKSGFNWANKDPKCRLFKDGNPNGLIKL